MEQIDCMIAGLKVRLEAFGRTIEQARPYSCEGFETPDIELSGNYRPYYEKYPYLGEDDAMYIFSANCFYSRLLDFDGLMLHSSAVVVDGRAYLFSATSGTGKSTHTGIWLKKFGERAYILNDDKPALRLIDGVWYACGTPWSGKYDISRPVCVPLAGIAMVNRGEENGIERYSGVKLVYELLEQTIRPGKKRARILELLDRLITDVPIWKLYCNMDPEAAEVSYAAMSGAEKE